MITGIDDAGVTIRHRDGSARFGIYDLDAKSQVLFALEPDLAIAAAKQENVDAAAYEKWIDQGLVEVTKSENERSVLKKINALKLKNNRAFAAAQHLAMANARPLAQPATSIHSGSRHYRYSSPYSNYRASQPIYHYTDYGQSSCYASRRSTHYQSVKDLVKQRRSHADEHPSKKRSFADTTLNHIP